VVRALNPNGWTEDAVALSSRRLHVKHTPIPQLLTSRQVADALGVDEFMLTDRIRRGLLPSPAYVGRLRVWSPADIAAARALFAEEAARGRRRPRRKFSAPAAKGAGDA